MARKKPMAKATIKKAHRMARGMLKHRVDVRNPWAVGTAQAKRAARKRKRRR